MKKLLTLVLVFILATATIPAAADFNIYPLAGRVISLDCNYDIVTFVDGAGNEWEFYSIEDWQIDDVVACIVWDAGTPEIFDDEIIDILYAGRL